MEKKYSIIGFDFKGKFIMFEVNDKEILIKSSLPKSDLISFLDICPKLINKDLRDDILEESRKKGRKRKCYSLDGNKWFKYEYISLKDKRILGNSIKAKYLKNISCEDWEKLKDNLTSEEYTEYLQNEEKEKSLNIAQNS